MGLRLSEGISIDRFRQISGHRLNAERLRYLEGIGMISVHGDNLSVTSDGRMVLNAVIRELLVE